jgi:hypothetical protein
MWSIILYLLSKSLSPYVSLKILNVYGRSSNTIGNLLNLPMFYTESIYNSYIRPMVNTTIRISTVLNYIKEAIRRSVLDSTETTKLLPGFLGSNKIEGTVLLEPKIK